MDCLFHVVSVQVSSGEESALTSIPSGSVGSVSMSEPFPRAHCKKYLYAHNFHEVANIFYFSFLLQWSHNAEAEKASPVS